MKNEWEKEVGGKKRKIYMKYNVSFDGILSIANGSSESFIFDHREKKKKYKITTCII